MTISFKQSIIILFSTFLLSGLGSCKKDWLDVKVDKLQAVPATLKDFQAILDNDGFVNRGDAIVLGELASDGHYTSEIAWLAATDRAINAYTWSHTRAYIEPTLGPWTITYKRVYTANIVLDGLKKIHPNNSNDQQTWNYIKGQALFHRADAFYRAAQIWAPPYHASSAGNDLSIPLKVESDVALPSIRSTVKQTYEQLINDLLLAKDLLPVSPLYKTHPSKVAVFSLLAQAHLSMRDYDKAGDYANECLQLYDRLLDYNSVPINGNFIGDFTKNQEVIFHIITNTTGIGGFLTTNCFIDSALYFLYDGNDLRRQIFFRKNANGSITFKGNYNNNTSSLFCGPSTAEIYLIRAECYARKGNTSAAMNDLNILLQKRWKNGTFQSFTATSSDDALFRVLQERKKELLLRGLRWSDLRRLNQEDRFKLTLTRTIGSQTYVLEPESYRYTFPISDDIISISGMSQNPGWE